MVILFGGVMFASASNDDNNQCRFKSEGNVYNGTKATMTYTWGDEGSNSSSSSSSGTVEGNLSIIKGDVSGSNSSGQSQTRTYSVQQTRTECCTSENKCTPNYRTGHSDKAVNADNSEW